MLDNGLHPKTPALLPADRASFRRSVLIVSMIACLGLCGCAVKQTDLTPEDRLSAIDGAAEGPEITGMLVVLDPALCPLPDGCGPRYSLLGINLNQQIELRGEIDDAHHDLLISVRGRAEVLSGKQRLQPGFENIELSINVKTYRTRTQLPYRQSLSQNALEFTLGEFGCELPWYKTYSWYMQDGAPFLRIRLSKIASDASRDFLELTYDGRNNTLSKQFMSTTQPPCDESNNL